MNKSELTENIYNLEKKEYTAILINANNKGYCRSLLDRKSIEYFMENFDKIDILTSVKQPAERTKYFNKFTLFTKPTSINHD